MDPQQLAEWKRRDARTCTIILPNIFDEQMVYVPPRETAAQYGNIFRNIKADWYGIRDRGSI